MKKQNINGLVLYRYSAKSYAIFGNSYALKDQLKAAGGKYNKFLKFGGVKAPGWIFGHKRKNEIENILNEIITI